MGKVLKPIKYAYLLRLSEEEKRALDLVCRAEGAAQSDVIRELILERAEKIEKQATR